jgi:methylphosphotriester-DNA--protein-cysteine methyltransferase
MQKMTLVRVSPESSPEQAQRMLALCIWIDAHIHESIGWSELMAQSGMDHQELQAAFTKHHATTPMTWIRKRREELNSQALAASQPVVLPSILVK